MSELEQKKDELITRIYSIALKFCVLTAYDRGLTQGKEFEGECFMFDNEKGCKILAQAYKRKSSSHYWIDYWSDGRRVRESVDTTD